jgi:hypothetical protein
MCILSISGVKDFRRKIIRRRFSSRWMDRTSMKRNRFFFIYLSNLDQNLVRVDPMLEYIYRKVEQIHYELELMLLVFGIRMKNRM